MPNNEGALISEVRLITREYGSYSYLWKMLAIVFPMYKIIF